MELTSEDAATIDSPTASEIREFLEPDSFGSYAMLASSENDFVQIGNSWQPTDECNLYIAQHKSDPWILEFHTPDKPKNQNQRATRYVTLEEATEVFCQFAEGRGNWLSNFDWQPFVWAVGP